MSDESNAPESAPEVAPPSDGGYDPAAAADAVTAKMNEIRQRAATVVNQRNLEEANQHDFEASQEAVEPDPAQASAEEPPAGMVAAEPEDVSDSEPIEGDDSENSPEFAALKREKELADRQAQLAAKEAELARKEQELEDFYKRLEQDPVQAIRERDVQIKPEHADDFFNESLGELAPEDYQAKRKLRELEAENARLKAQAEEAQRSTVQSQFQEYQNTLRGAVEGVSAEKYPAMARVVEVYGADDAFQQAWAAAQHYARAGHVATPEQVLEAVNAHYAPLVGAVPDTPSTPPATPKAAPPKSKSSRPRSLRNNMQKAQTPPKPIEQMTDAERRAYWGANATRAFEAALQKG